MLRLYTDTAYLTPEYRKYIFPLLLDLHYLEQSELNDYFEIVNDIERSDVAVFPINITHLYLLRRKAELVNFIDKARTNHKIIWVFSGGDIGLTLPFEDIFVFRLGGFNSKMGKNTMIFPSFISDPLEIALKTDFLALPKTEIPEIGFVGHAQTGFVKYMEEVSSFIRWNLRRYRGRAFTDFQPFYPSGVLRGKYLNFLQKEPSLKCNFIFRNKYRAGAITSEEKERTTREFFQNIYENLYTICIRGHGNFSVRLYEVLAMGRIPILIDTDCRLPLDQSVSWKEHVLLVKEEDVYELPSKIFEFHSRLTEDELIDMQLANRILWKERLQRTGYFKQIHDIFLKSIQQQ